MGAEIDILATNRKNNIWVEVSVSTSPRCNFLKDVRFKNTVQEYLKDFKREDKTRKVNEYFGNKFEKWLVHGKLALSKDEIKEFPTAMKRNGVHVVYFGDIFQEMRKLKQYRIDSARGYMNLFEVFHVE
jgi:hypothetical protein